MKITFVFTKAKFKVTRDVKFVQKLDKAIQEILEEEPSLKEVPIAEFKTSTGKRVLGNQSFINFKLNDGDSIIINSEQTKDEPVKEPAKAPLISPPNPSIKPNFNPSDKYCAAFNNLNKTAAKPNPIQERLNQLKMERLRGTGGGNTATQPKFAKNPIHNKIEPSMYDKVNNGIIVQVKITNDNIGKAVQIFNNDEDLNYAYFIKDISINFNPMNIISNVFAFNQLGEHVVAVQFKQNLKTCEGMFYDCKDILVIDFTKFISTNVLCMEATFSGCGSLEEIRGLETFKTTRVTEMGELFQNCKRIRSLDLSGFDTRNVTNMSYMFDSCSSLEEIKGLENFKMDKVTSTGWQFYQCVKLKSLNLCLSNSRKLEYIGGMFSDCNELEEIKGLETINTSKVNNMEAVFQNCFNLKSINVSSFDTSNVTCMQNMFSNCESAEEIKGLENFITERVTNMANLFNYCSKLTSLSVASFDTKNVTDMNGMFHSCSNLEKIEGIEKFNTENVINFSQMFEGAKKLGDLNIQNFSYKSCEYKTNMMPK